MFVGDRLWIFNCPNRLPPSQQQQWMKSVNNIASTNVQTQLIDRNMLRTINKPEMSPFAIPAMHPNERVAFMNMPEQNMASTVKIGAQRLLPREVYNNVATAQRNMDVYKNNILNHSTPPQESNVDHLRRLEENFSI